jgi:diacylglycerol kinase (ATP)
MREPTIRRDNVAQMSKSEVEKVAVVRNPKSGRGRNMQLWGEVEARLRLRFPEFLVVETYASGSARPQAADLAREGCTVVVAAGGDGTVRDVMEGVLGTEAALAVLPLGTGNDFSRSLGFGTSVDAAVAAVEVGQRKRIDVGEWTRGDEKGHFVNVAGCGFDAVMAERVNQGVKHLRGKLAYVVAILEKLPSFKACNLKLKADGETLQTRAMLCAFANAKSYGGGMMFAPMAEMTDGVLDLVLVEELSLAQFLWTFPRVYSGKHMSHPKVKHRPFRTLEIESDPPVLFLMDGEVLAPGPLRIEVLPSALDVIVLPGKGC